MFSVSTKPSDLPLNDCGVNGLIGELHVDERAAKSGCCMGKKHCITSVNAS